VFCFNFTDPGGRELREGEKAKKEKTGESAGVI
jgi:hypothetical protein